MEDVGQQIEEALKVVGTYFEDVDKMCIEGFYKVEAPRYGNMEEILRCIKLFAMIKNIEKERDKEGNLKVDEDGNVKEIKLIGRKLEVLGYYLKFGYSKKTKDTIIKNLKITDSNLNNVNHDLRRIGVIERQGYNQSNNRVNQELLDFKNFIVNQKGQYTLIKWT